MAKPRTIRWHGIPVKIEVDRGGERSGKSPDGRKWSVTMPCAYGCIPGTKGQDGEEIDVFVGSEIESPEVFAINQVDPGTKKFDEQKIMLGFKGADDAAANYVRAFSDGKGKDRIGKMMRLDRDVFKSQLEDLRIKAFASGGVAHGWARTNPDWQRLDPYQKAAAMALMEADGRNVDDARNALGAMINRASKTGEDLGLHVSRAIYQPTMERSQEKRLSSIIGTPEFADMANWARQRSAGEVADPVSGATHFLAPERTMLALESREPNKYRSWRDWTGFDPETRQYRGVVLRDGGHAFLAPEGRHGAEANSVVAAHDPARAAAVSATAGPSEFASDASLASAPREPAFGDAIGREILKSVKSWGSDDDQARLIAAPRLASSSSRVDVMPYGGDVKEWLGMPYGEKTAKMASGGMVRGPLKSPMGAGGRTDTLPIEVEAGSFVFPADTVSALGENDTDHGFRVLERMFAPAREMMRLPSMSRAIGGVAGKEAVPIVAAAGEYVASPDEVAWAGDGDLEAGHKILERLVMKVRADHIKELKSLPKPHK